MSLESNNDPKWSTWSEAVNVILRRPYLIRTARIALIVGTKLFVINHYEELIAGFVAPPTWSKGVATCIVPFLSPTGCGGRIVLTDRSRP